MTTTKLASTTRTGIGKHFTLRLIDRAHADRPELENYVRAVFYQRFGARPQHLFPWIAELRDHFGIRIGALGLRWGCKSSFFSEVYLEEPADCAIARHFRRPLERSQIMEVGHFAASHAGAGRITIVAMAALTAQLPVAWILGTLNRPIRRSFGRAGVPLVELAEARAKKMGAEAHCWGRYYESQPKVMAVDISMGRRTLSVTGGLAQIDVDLSTMDLSAIGKLELAG